MGKRIRLFCVLLLTCVTLFAAPNYFKQLETYDQQMRGANNDEVLRVFHGLKGIYIQSIISGDDKLKEQTLERLIKSAKILKLDASKYESELKIIQKEPHKKIAEEKKTFSPPATPMMLENQEKESVASSNENKTNLPTSYKGKNVLHSAKGDKEAIVLDFGMAIASERVKVFGLNSPNSYKKVIDIPAIILGTPPSLTPPSNLQNIRITQYSTDTIRVVLDASKIFDTYISVVNNSVIIAFSKQPVNVSKSVPVQQAHSAPVLAPSPIPTPQLTKNTPTPVAPKSVRNKTIVIDAGHGGKDAGAIGYKQRMEKHLVLDITLQLGKHLKQKGYKVFYTRDKDIFINLRDRTKVANDKNADLFLSLHANAAPTEAKKLSMKGLETFFLSPDRSERSKNVAALENKSDIEEMDFYSKETFLNVFNREKIVLSNKLAIDIQANMLGSVKKKYEVDDGGVREAPFWVLVGATMPSVLIEIGYITNPDESDKMFNLQYQKLIVEGISNGIDQYFTNNP